MVRVGHKRKNNPLVKVLDEDVIETMLTARAAKLAPSISPVRGLLPEFL
jgi:hypothetical protein